METRPGLAINIPPSGAPRTHSLGVRTYWTVEQVESVTPHPLRDGARSSNLDKMATSNICARALCQPGRLGVGNVLPCAPGQEAQLVSGVLSEVAGQEAALAAGWKESSSHEMYPLTARITVYSLRRDYSIMATDGLDVLG